MFGEKRCVCHLVHSLSAIPIVSLKARSPHTFLQWLLPPPPAAAAVTCRRIPQSGSLTATSEPSGSVHPDPRRAAALSDSVWRQRQWGVVLIEVDGFFFFPMFYSGIVALKSRMFDAQSEGTTVGCCSHPRRRNKLWNNRS